jgi:hypothetical protein
LSFIISGKTELDVAIILATYAGGAGGAVAIPLANVSNCLVKSSNHLVVVSPFNTGSFSC